MLLLALEGLPLCTLSLQLAKICELSCAIAIKPVLLAWLGRLAVHSAAVVDRGSTG